MHLSVSPSLGLARGGWLAQNCTILIKERSICGGALIPITPLRGDMGAVNSPPSCLPARVHPYRLQTGSVRHHIAAVTSSPSFQISPNLLSLSI